MKKMHTHSDTGTEKRRIKMRVKKIERQIQGIRGGKSSNGGGGCLDDQWHWNHRNDNNNKDLPREWCSLACIFHFEIARKWHTMQCSTLKWTLMTNSLFKSTRYLFSFHSMHLLRLPCLVKHRSLSLSVYSRLSKLIFRFYRNIGCCFVGFIHSFVHSVLFHLFLIVCVCVPFDSILYVVCGLKADLS